MGTLSLPQKPQKDFNFFALRGYQSDLVGAIFSGFKRRERVVAQIATGAGKTAIGAALCDRFVKQQGRVLWLAHREELLEQAYEKLEEVCVAPVAMIQSGKKIRPEGLIQVASVQTLARRSTELDIDLIVTDEAHHAVSPTYQKVYDRYPHAYHLGLTATPKRLDGKGLDTVFDHLVCGVAPTWLIENKYLSPYRLFVAKHLINTRGIRTQAGDFKLTELSIAARSAEIMGEVVSSWQEHANGLQTVVFCCDIAHSMAVCQLYQEAGIKAAHLDGDTPKEQRRKILADFENKAITVLTNCGIVSEGLDIPGIECVQNLRPTESLSLYLQMVGRSLRPAPGKEWALILDHTHNWTKKKHGLPDDDRVWSLDGTTKQTYRETIALPNGRVVEVSPRYSFHDPDAEMIEVTRQMIQEAERQKQLEAERIKAEQQRQIQEARAKAEAEQRAKAEAEQRAKVEAEQRAKALREREAALAAQRAKVWEDDSTARAAKQLADFFGGRVVDVPMEPAQPSAPSPFPWIEELMSQQVACGYKKGWVVYQILDRLRERFDEFLQVRREDVDKPTYARRQLEFFMQPLEYAAAKLDYRSGWAGHKYNELLDEVEALLQQEPPDDLYDDDEAVDDPEGRSLPLLALLQPVDSPRDSESARVEDACESSYETSDVWQPFLSCLRPSLQMLLKQQGCLLSLTRHEAVLGVKVRWKDWVCQRLLEVEDAFDKTLGRRVAVKIQVLTTQEEGSK